MNNPHSTDTTLGVILRLSLLGPLLLIALVAALLSACSREQAGGDLSVRPQTNNIASDSKAVSAAEATVSKLLAVYGRNRREFVKSLAERRNEKVPADVERFFDAVDSAKWDQIESLFNDLAKRSGRYVGQRRMPELDPYFTAVIDVYGAAETVHLWPAQKLLDYGEAILDSLRPGMVYVGGTDPGRWIPSLLSGSSGRDPFVVVTQNALVDARYLEFVSALYEGKLVPLTEADSEKAFED